MNPIGKGGSSNTASDTSNNNNKNKNVMKRADQRSSITILVLGDEGVGKSSLISTFVSRYFSEVVPGIMTRVRLPPDPQLQSNCITTIIDSQMGDIALYQQAVATTSAALQLRRQQQQNVSSGSLYNIANQNASNISLATYEQQMKQHQQQQDQQGGDGSRSISDFSSIAALRMTQQQQQSQAPASASTTATTTTTKQQQNDDDPILPNTTTSTATSSSTVIENVDSIVLIYDLDRIETFYRLENHWLPLIEKCYQGKVPVIVAENKMDLFRPSSSISRSTSNLSVSASSVPQQQQQQTDEQAMIRKRQQIVAMMQRYPFVRQCIKCSAKQLLRVDDVFIKAQQAVLYPFVPPLYDLETGQITIECRRAFTRIFRMYDKDFDGLLSDMELDRFQRDTYHFAIVDRDLAAWKKVVVRNNPSETAESVLQDGKFTIQGFLTIFDVFISQNRLDVVWQALRKYNYDDDLNLHVPDSIMNPEDDFVPSASSTTTGAAAKVSSSWKLSSSAKQFLTKLFCQFDSDKDGYLSPEDIVTIFSVLPPPSLPPWHPMRALELFERCFSVPKESPNNGSSSGTDSPNGDYGGDTSLIVPSATIATLHQEHSILSTSGVSLLSEGDSLPTLDVGGMYPLSKSISYLDWMGYWHTISAISPAIARVELYRLGFVEDSDRKSRSTTDRRRNSRRQKAKQKKDFDDLVLGKSENPNAYKDATLPSREILVTVLGKRNSGKTALINALCGTFDSADINHRPLDTTTTYRPETSTTFVKLKRSYLSNGNGIGSATKIDDREGEELVVHLVFMDVPESAAIRQEEHLRQLNELFGPANATSKDRFCDIAMLVFDSTDSSSLALVKDMEAKLLSKDTPRLFVATKSDLVSGTEADDNDEGRATAFDEAAFHCRESDIELPLSTSVTDAGLGIDRLKILEHIATCALDGESGIKSLKSVPHEAEKRREAAYRRHMMWIGGIVSVGVAVAVGVGLLLATGVATAAKKDQKSSFSWLRSLFGGGIRNSKETPYSA